MMHNFLFLLSKGVMFVRKMFLSVFVFLYKGYYEIVCNISWYSGSTDHPEQLISSEHRTARFELTVRSTNSKNSEKFRSGRTVRTLTNRTLMDPDDMSTFVFRVSGEPSPGVRRVSFRFSICFILWLRISISVVDFSKLSSSDSTMAFIVSFFLLNIWTEFSFILKLLFRSEIVQFC